MVTQDRHSNHGNTPSISTPAKEKGSRPSLILNTTIFIFLGLYTIFFLYHSVVTLAFPYILDYGEGPVFGVAKYMAAGNGIYLDITRPPYMSTNYTPLYFAINAAAIWLFGLSTTYGKLLSLLATFGLAGLIFMVVKGK